MSRRKWPEQETFVMREYRRAGLRYDPETVCQYTGLALHQFPLEVGDGLPQLIGYWRTDGELCGAYAMTEAEKAWIAANFAQYRQENARFESWLRAVRIKRNESKLEKA